MSTKKPTANTPTTVVANDPEDRKGRLKTIGGSQSDHWNSGAHTGGSGLEGDLGERGNRDGQLSHTLNTMPLT